MRYTLAFALQLRKKDGKTSVRVAQMSSKICHDIMSSVKIGRVKATLQSGASVNLYPYFTYFFSNLGKSSIQLCWKVVSFAKIGVENFVAGANKIAFSRVSRNITF